MAGDEDNSSTTGDTGNSNAKDTNINNSSRKLKFETFSSSP